MSPSAGSRVMWTHENENEREDRAAKEAAMRTAKFVSKPNRDWFPLIKETAYSLWNETWKGKGRELGIMKEKPGKLKPKMVKHNRREEAIS